MARKTSDLKKFTEGAKTRKVIRNSDGSRTVLMSDKGFNGIKIWYPKKGAAIITVSKRVSKKRYKR